MKITPKIYYTDTFGYIKLNEVPVELYKPLLAFMYGQTMPYIDKDIYAIYVWDYENFINKLLGRPHFFD